MNCYQHPPVFMGVHVDERSHTAAAAWVTAVDLRRPAEVRIDCRYFREGERGQCLPCDDAISFEQITTWLGHAFAQFAVLSVTTSAISSPVNRLIGLWVRDNGGKAWEMRLTNTAEVSGVLALIREMVWPVSDRWPVRRLIRQLMTGDVTGISRDVGSIALLLALSGLEAGPRKARLNFLKSDDITSLSRSTS